MNQEDKYGPEAMDTSRCDFMTRGLRCMLPVGHPDDHAVIPCPVTDNLGRQCVRHRGHADEHMYPPPECPTCHEKHWPDVACRLEALAGKETVNHPPHYGGDNPYEHWRVMVAWGLVNDAFLYNCTKYICRAGKKGVPNHSFVSCGCTIDQPGHRQEVCHWGGGCSLTEEEHHKLSTGIEDLRKARWYLERAIESLEKK